MLLISRDLPSYVTIPQTRVKTLNYTTCFCDERRLTSSRNKTTGNSGLCKNTIQSEFVGKTCVWSHAYEMIIQKRRVKLGKYFKFNCPRHSFMRKRPLTPALQCAKNKFRNRIESEPLQLKHSGIDLDVQKRMSKHDTVLFSRIK